MPHSAPVDPLRRRFPRLLAGLALVASFIPLRDANALPTPGTHSLTQWLQPWASHALAARVLSVANVHGALAQASARTNTPPAALGLQMARQALREDAPVRAAFYASHYLSDPVNSAEAAQARDILGYASWRAGDYERAYETLKNAQESDPQSRIAPWRLAWLADAAFRLGRYDDAIMYGAISIELGPKQFSAFTARAANSRAHALMSPNPDPRTLQEFLDVHPEYPQMRDALVELTQSWMAVGNFRIAARTAEKLLYDAPWTPQAGRIRQLLNESEALRNELHHPSPEERFLSAQNYRSLRQWDSAEAELEALQADSEAKKSGALPLDRVRFERARNAMEAGDYEAARALFDALDPNQVEGANAWEVLREKGYNLTRLGIHQDALMILRESAALRGGQAGTDLLYEYLFDLGHFSEARSMVSRLSSNRRPDAFERAFLDYLSADYESAIRAFNRIAQSAADHQRHQANYWAARAELHMGDVHSARIRFGTIVQTRPHDYYGILAKSRLLDLDAAGATQNDEPGTIPMRRLPGRLHWEGESDARPADFGAVSDRANELTAYSDELAAAPPLAETIAPWLDRLPELALVADLANIGADEDARKVYREVVDEIVRTRAERAPTGNRPASISGTLWEHSIDNRSEKRGWWGIPFTMRRFFPPETAQDRDRLIQRQRAIHDGGDALTQAMIDIGRAIEDHHVVRRLVQRERGLSGNPPTSGDRRENWLEAYPRPFPSTVVSLTRRYNMNPYVLWALIIVESDMNPDAISRADAYGLMQVIPKTGDRVAWEIGDTSFGIHDLLDPHQAIRYGAWYMGALIHKFHNQESLALIGYNAGPHRVARWLDWRGSDLDYDEFLETVPFPGARNYHKRILRYAATYQMLYEHDMKLYIGLDLDTSYDPSVNF